MKIRSPGISKLWLDKVLNFRGGWKPASRQLTVVDFELVDSVLLVPSYEDEPSWCSQLQLYSIDYTDMKI